MTKHVHSKLPANQHFNYCFFDRQYGVSGRNDLKPSGERNVNIFSVNHAANALVSGTPENVVENITRCFNDMGATADAPKFFLTAKYQGFVHTLTPITLNALIEESRKYAANQDQDKLSSRVVALLAEKNIFVLPADGMAICDIETPVFVAGAGGDAHPIIIHDEKTNRAGYLSGAHANIKGKGLEQILHAIEATSKTRVVIGPGLGPDSYEFGANAASVFFEGLAVKESQLNRCFRFAKKADQTNAILVNFAAIIEARLQLAEIDAEVLDMEINTLGFSLVKQQEGNDSSEPLQLLSDEERFECAEVAMSKAKFYSARGGELARRKNPIAREDHFYLDQGRHAAVIASGLFGKVKVSQRPSGDDSSPGPALPQHQ